MNFLNSLVKTRLHRWFVLGALAFVLALGFTARVDAANFRIIHIQCITPQEKDANGDELRMKITSDTGLTQTHRQNNMKKGSIWGFDQTMLQCNKTVRVNLTEVDSVKTDGIHFRDEDLGTVTLTADPLNTIRKVSFKGNGANYILTYQFIVNPPREMEILSVRCIVPQEKGSKGDDLRLRIKADGGKEITLSRNGMKKGSVWVPGKTVQFFTKVSLTLVEHDGFGIHFRDENLGTKVIPVPGPGLTGNNGETRVVRFTGHGANYELTYRIKAR